MLFLWKKKKESAVNMHVTDVLLMTQEGLYWSEKNMDKPQEATVFDGESKKLGRLLFFGLDHTQRYRLVDAGDGPQGVINNVGCLGGQDRKDGTKVILLELDCHTKLI